jgi:DNA-binding NtrC family response regulator
MWRRIDRGPDCPAWSRAQTVMPTHPDLLIVEDNSLILTSLLTFLAPLRLSIATAANGDEAMGLLANTSGLGALITDICMPGSVNAVGLAMVARCRFPGLPVLLMTGFAPSDGLELTRHPGCRLMMKPLRARTLVAQVMEILGRQRLTEIPSSARRAQVIQSILWDNRLIDGTSARS